MGAFGPTTETESLVVDRSNTASENGVIFNPFNSGNTRIAISARGGSTIEIGATEDDLAGLGAQIQSAFAGVADLGSIGDNTGTVEDAVAERLKDQIVESPARDRELGKSNWILLVVGAVILLGAALVSRHKKKTA